MRLTKQLRDRITNRALFNAYGARFEEEAKKAEATYSEFLKEKYSRFYELFEDPENRPHLSYVEPTRVEYETEDSWGGCVRVKAENGAWVTHRPKTPAIPSTRFGEAASALPAEMAYGYVALLGEHAAAKEALVSLLNGYTTVEKLRADFPELAALIEEPKPAENLPAVPSQDLRAQLQKFGIL